VSGPREVAPAGVARGPTMCEEIVRDARREHLPALLAFVQAACARAALTPDDAAAVRLAAEEACTNVVAHAYAGAEPGPVSLRFERDARQVVVTVEDRAAPFDPALVAAPDLTAGWADRELGGLGWHLIRQVMDEVRHEHDPAGGNRLTLVKLIGGK
jgi:serine/threonine-protein kinase RsbW